MRVGNHKRVGVWPRRASSASDDTPPGPVVPQRPFRTQLGAATPFSIGAVPKPTGYLFPWPHGVREPAVPSSQTAPGPSYRRRDLLSGVGPHDRLRPCPVTDPARSPFFPNPRKEIP